MKILFAFCVIAICEPVFSADVTYTGRLERNKTIFATSLDFESKISFVLDLNNEDIRSRCDACKNKIIQMVHNKEFDGLKVKVTSNGFDSIPGTVIQTFDMTSEKSENLNFRVQYEILGMLHNVYCSTSLNSEEYNVSIKY